MPQVRPLKELGQRYLVVNATLTILCVLCGIFLFFRASTRDVWFYTAGAVLVSCSVAAFAMDRVMIRRIKCPQCGRELTREKAPRGKLITIQYLCPTCDVIWDTAGTPDPSREYSDPL